MHGDKCDRWRQIEFQPSHLSIWTGACEPGSYAMAAAQAVAA